MTDNHITDAAQTEKVSRELEFEYCNWEGRKSIRRVRPISVRFGKSEWHPKPQWLMLALDLDKGQEREFAMNDMEFIDEFPSGVLPLAAQPHHDCSAATERETALEAAALDFIAKVDRGEARSKHSYAAFKAALALTRPHGECGK
jgi:predicted DNA-binding transcriptional regulator YafY